MEDFRFPIVKAIVSGDNINEIQDHIKELNLQIKNLKTKNQKADYFIQKIFHSFSHKDTDVSAVYGDYGYDIVIQFDKITNEQKIHLQHILPVKKDNWSDIQ